MNIGNIATNDSMASFFKAVESARQRNVTAFDRVKPAASFKPMVKPETKKSVSPSGLNEQYMNKMTVANTGTTAMVKPQKQIQTKILGNFFDAYA